MHIKPTHNKQVNYDINSENEDPQLINIHANTRKPYGQVDNRFGKYSFLNINFEILAELIYIGAPYNAPKTRVQNFNQKYEVSQHDIHDDSDEDNIIMRKHNFDPNLDNMNSHPLYKNEHPRARSKSKSKSKPKKGKDKLK
jgi:hypothetical protein